MMERNLGYDFRSDGMFLVRKKCAYCGELFDTLAIAQFRDTCDACHQVEKWESEVPKEK